MLIMQFDLAREKNGMIKKLNKTKKELRETKRSERKHKKLFYILSEAKKYIFFKENVQTHV